MPHRSTPRALGALAAAALGLAVLSGCSAPAPDGGADALPTGAPDGVTYETVATAPPAPPVVGRLLDHTRVDLADVWAERPVLLQFTASWCERCGEQQSELDAVAERWGDAVAIVHIDGESEDDRDQIEAFLRDHDVTQPVVLDPDLQIWRAYAVAEPPMTALVDTAGGLVRLWPGGADADAISEQLEQLVDD